MPVARVPSQLVVLGESNSSTRGDDDCWPVANRIDTAVAVCPDIEMEQASDCINWYCGTALRLLWVNRGNISPSLYAPGVCPAWATGSLGNNNFTGGKIEMSRASALVRFPDGTIKHGIYNGTADVMWDVLWDSCKDAWRGWGLYYNTIEHRLADNSLSCHCSGQVDVEIYSSYGGGYWWEGKGCQKCMVITNGLDPYDPMEFTDGCPEWAEDKS